MSDVTAIGLGAMGAAIARALIDGGHEVTLWNRSPARFDAFAGTSATAQPDLAAAISASPVSIICIDDYDASFALLDSVAGDVDFGGRTLVQFSTGTPGEARAGERWAGERGARWLDGAVLAYPGEVGAAGLVFVAGDADAERATRDLLGCLSSELRYRVPAVGAPPALALAVLSCFLGAHTGLVHGALICGAEKVSPRLLSEVLVASQPGDAEELEHLGAALADERYDAPNASLAVYAGVVRRVLAHAGDAGISDEIPRFVAGLIERGLDAGLGDDEIVALVKLLRRRPT